MANISNKTKQRLLRLDTQAKFPYLIEVTYYFNDENNKKTSIIFRYANCDDDIEFEGNTFEAGSFSLAPPEKTQTSIGDSSITISCIDQFWIEKIRKIKKYRAEIRFVASIEYTEDNERFIEALEDYEFVLTEANYSETAIQWKMVFDDVLSINVPSDEATVLKTPAVV